jgi:phenylacetate-CoA ligase
LENWPVLEKEDVRNNPRAFVADDCNINRMFHEHTSGTSGKPLDLWWSRETVRRWYALFEARCRRWYGVSRFNRWAILGGQLVVPATQRRPPFWVWNAPLNQLYMSSYHLAPDLLPAYLEALTRYRIEYLFGYTSSLYSLGQHILSAGVKAVQMRVVITNAEPLYDYQREIISEAFKCPVRETYGMAEIVATASECTSGRLHLWPEVGIIEFFDQNVHVQNGPADLVCTGLFNADMPLVRYRIGDRAALAEFRESCGCGRAFPAMDKVEGRADDMLYTVDGRCVGRLDPVFKGGLPIREAQIIQESFERVRVLYVPARGFSSQTEAAISERVRDRLGHVEVVMEPTTQIPRETNGKFRAVICRLSAQDKEKANKSFSSSASFAR